MQLTERKIVNCGWKSEQGSIISKNAPSENSFFGFHLCKFRSTDPLRWSGERLPAKVALNADQEEVFAISLAKNPILPPKPEFSGIFGAFPPKTPPDPKKLSFSQTATQLDTIAGFLAKKGFLEGLTDVKPCFWQNLAKNALLGGATHVGPVFWQK